MKTQLKMEIDSIVERNMIYKELEQLAESRNYIKVLPDYFEEYNSFLKLNKRIDPKTMVKIIAPSNEIYLLRPDITTNLIKQLIPCWSPGSSVQFYYNTTVFEQTNKGIIQSRQFGLELLGKDDISAERQILEDVLLVFESFKSRFRLVLGNQFFIDSLIDSISYLEKSTVKNIIMSKDTESLLAIIKGDSLSEKLLMELFSLNGTIGEVVTKLKEYSSLDFVTEVIKLFNDLGQSFDTSMINMLEIDLSLLSQYDYYSGIIVQGFLKNIPYPILNGGRYNNLTKEMGKEIPAFGISFDVSSFVKEAKNV